MNVEAMTKWIEALEDPANEKRQIRGQLCDDHGGVCALGLANEVFAQINWVPGGNHLAPMFFVKSETSRTGFFGVAYLNDAGWSFWDIAQALRATHLKENT